MTSAQVAVARREKPGAHALVSQYKQDFTTVLPSHLRAETWVRVAQGALKRGKKLRDDPAGRTELEVAAVNNPAAFLSAMLDAARLGLEPGTEQFYLTPRRVKGQLEILGIVGWQGYVELMYRAGAVSSVVAEVVHANDRFSFKPGRDEVPDHDIDWDAEDRGPLRLAYAYARMKDGSTSKVVVLNKAAIDRAKKSSQGSDSEYSPWQQHEAAMWLKTAVRQLAKWVPTSAERYSVAGNPVQHVEVERTDRPEPLITALPAPAGGLDEHHVDYGTGEVHDAEIVEDPPAEPADWPTVAEPGGAR
jgi:recombination protein RecT